jgi:Domain of unknown function (DUF4389)
MAVSVDAYPVVFTAERLDSSSRFFAIPIIGLLAKLIILIPHFIILYVLGGVLGLAHLVIWVPVLFGGRYPDWGFSLSAGVVRWAMRVYLYIFGLNDQYPAFSFDAPGDISIAFPESSNRLWAIPLFGFVIKYIILIPHFIILYVLSLAVNVCQLVTWIPVLFTGQYPDWGFQLVSGLVIWNTRVLAYLLGLSDRYPPFSMS